MHPGDAPRERIFYLDIIRVVACLFVIMMHASIRNYDALIGTTGFNIYALTFSISSKLFFMISGALLLPISREPRQFIKRRLRAVVIPLAVWSVVYFIEMLIFDCPSKDEIKRTLLSVPFTPVEVSLWFVYAMVGIYLMMPIVSRCIEALERRWIEYYLALWLLSGVIPFINGLFYTVEFHHTVLASTCNYLGYIILGYYLHRYEPPIFSRQNIFKSVLAVAVICIGLPLFVLTYQAAYYMPNPSEQLATITHDLGINTMVVGIVVFSALQLLAKRFAYGGSGKSAFRKLVTSISICSFGIYLCHMLVYRQVVWRLLLHVAEDICPVHPLLLDVLCAVVCFAACYAITSVIRVLPFSRYLIGH